MNLNDFHLLEHDYANAPPQNPIFNMNLNNHVPVLHLFEHNYANAPPQNANLNADLNNIAHRLPRLQNDVDVAGAQRRAEHALRERARAANLTYEQAQQRREQDAVWHNQRRANENVHEANARQQVDAQRHRANRENELPQQAAVRRRAELLRHRARVPRFLNLARINNVLLHILQCCHNGKVALPAILQFPAEIRELLSNNSAQAKQFRKYIRVYNNAFSFASLSANIPPPPGHGPPCFRICGQLFHRGCSCLRIENPTHAHCNRETMQIIQDVLNRDSPYAAAYRNMAEVEREETARAAAENRQPSVVSMVMREGNDRRRYNAPLHQEVAAIFVGNDGAPPAARDIVVYPRNQPLRQIPHISCNIDPMMYPILFPRGDLGWDQNMAHVREHATGVRNRLTQLEYYIYRIAIRRNQNQLRAESYQGLLDYLQNAADQRNLQTGNVVVLPSTFSGSPRNMHQLYLDAMALVSKKASDRKYSNEISKPPILDSTNSLGKTGQGPVYD
ncbi:uncharacterized protein LOC130642265 [Hydractinia symbiolongicarpus]|uniref:uncharacterized protein LOC130642265 n=1 Tax=Hydractinia symbiolongicarpus TaxID=13093 RepID=UPI00254E8698|nr:uncharacterized protein LOC130642265 [Hydractinia symbiolongicarpus]